MTKKIIVGTTGSGKTYHTIHTAQEIGSFAYIAPCRQLAYEVYIDYANVGVDTLSTGEVKMGSGGNFYGVYESLDSNVSEYESLIIDEAHYITDYDRGGHLVELINQAKKLNINIFLVTATRNFPLWRGWDLEELKPKFTPPKKVLINYDEYIERRDAGVPTIEFKKYKSEAMLSADTLPSDRLQLQLDYRAGKIKYVSSTNVLAQGINMPCENLYIEYNPYDDSETLEQKLGRLGRMGFTNSDTVTYCIRYMPKPLKKNKKKAKIINRLQTKNIHGVDITCNQHEFPKNLSWTGYSNEYLIFFDFEYSDIRYSKPFLHECKKAGVKKDFVEEAFSLLNKEEEKIKNIINFYGKNSKNTN
jgi:superfamily II DNA or RNA helicase